ncbi:MAG TPA: hypothetical protein VH541_11060 [Gaiellaceae bacterium]
MTNWLKRLFGGSDESSTSEAPAPATAPEPPATPAEPTVEPTTPPAEGTSDTGNEPA